MSTGMTAQGGTERLNRMGNLTIRNKSAGSHPNWGSTQKGGGLTSPAKSRPHGRAAHGRTEQSARHPVAFLDVHVPARDREYSLGSPCPPARMRGLVGSRSRTALLTASRNGEPWATVQRSMAHRPSCENRLPEQSHCHSPLSTRAECGNIEPTFWAVTGLGTFILVRPVTSYCLESCKPPGSLGPHAQCICTERVWWLPVWSLLVVDIMCVG